MGAVFRSNADGTYDLEINGRAIDYDVEAEDFHDAVRRARYIGQVLIEDETGYRTPLGRR